MTPRKHSLVSGLVLALFSMVLLSSCVTSQRDVLYLNDQILALNEKIRKLEQSMDAKLTGDVESVRDRNAELLAEMDSVRAEIQRISGRVEENEHLLKRAVERDTTQGDVLGAGFADLTQRVGENEARVKQLYTYLKLEPPADPRAGITGGAAPQAVAPVSPSPPATGQPASSPSPPQTPEEALYDASLADYKGGNYEKAIVGFKRFLDEFPKSKLVDNAQFWIGESFMALRQYEQAILAYQQVIKNYPNGNKVPSALLRQALAFNELKDNISYKLLLQKIVKQYPNSSEAEIAKTKLASLK